jgi:dephospho-CoA kinase
VADDKLRIAAAILRDGISEEEYHSRMKNQMSPVAKKMGSKYIIQNDYTSGVVEQIKALHNKLNKC